MSEVDLEKSPNLDTPYWILIRNYLRKLSKLSSLLKNLDAISKFMNIETQDVTWNVFLNSQESTELSLLWILIQTICISLV